MLKRPVGFGITTRENQSCFFSHRGATKNAFSINKHKNDAEFQLPQLPSSTTHIAEAAVDKLPARIDIRETDLLSEAYI